MTATYDPSDVFSLRTQFTPTLRFAFYRLLGASMRRGLGYASVIRHLRHDTDAALVGEMLPAIAFLDEGLLKGRHLSEMLAPLLPPDEALLFGIDHDDVYPHVLDAAAVLAKAAFAPEGAVDSAPTSLVEFELPPVMVLEGADDTSVQIIREALDGASFVAIDDLDDDAQPANPAVEAIAFALATDDGLAFLRCWNEGDFDAIRREWPDAPEDVFVGADSLYLTDSERAVRFMVGSRKLNAMFVELSPEMRSDSGRGAESAVNDAPTRSLEGLGTFTIRATSESDLAEQVDQALRADPDCVVFRELPSTPNAFRKLVQSGLSVLSRSGSAESKLVGTTVPPDPLGDSLAPAGGHPRE